MKFRKPYKNHHKKRTKKKDPNWSAPKDVQDRKAQKREFKKIMN